MNGPLLCNNFTGLPCMHTHQYHDTQVFSSIGMAKICLAILDTSSGRSCLTNLSSFKVDETWQHFRQDQSLPTGRFRFSKFAFFPKKSTSVAMETQLKRFPWQQKGLNCIL